MNGGVAESAQCTANFVFTDGADVLPGQAAHRSGTGAANETDGCRAGSQRIRWARPSRSTAPAGRERWSPIPVLAMQAAGERNSGACLGNDFALIELDPAGHGAAFAAGSPAGDGALTHAVLARTREFHRPDSFHRACGVPSSESCSP